MKIDKQNVQDIFELSKVQQGMLYHHLKNETDNLYTVQLALDIRGHLELDRLKDAVDAVQQQNDVLRSVFSWEHSNKPLQLILKKCPVDIQYHDLATTGKENTGAAIDLLLAKDRDKRFDLSAVPLRFTVIRTTPASFVLCITHHHILYDGWSTGILLQELFDVYHRAAGGDKWTLQSKPSYKTIWRDLQAHAADAESASYWKNYLAGYMFTGFFPTDHNGSKQCKYTFRLPGTPVARLAAQNNVTKAAIIYAAYGLLLCKYFNRKEAVFGTVMSGRPATVQHIDAAMGNFITTLPFRLDNWSDKTLLEIIAAVNSEMIDRESLSGSSYAEIKEALQLRPDENLFDSAVVIENYPLPEKEINAKASLNVALRAVYEHTDVPVMITVFLQEDITIEMTCSETIAGGIDIDGLGQRMLLLLETMTTQPGKKAAALSLVSKEEEKLLAQYNATSTAYDGESTLVSVFRSQARDTPLQAAVRYEDTVITYRELDEFSDKVAGYLSREKNIQTGDLVGLLLEREAWLPGYIYGILKAGAAYVPMDPGHPDERLHTIVSDAGLKAVFTRNKYCNEKEILKSTGRLVDLDAISSLLEKQPVNKLPPGPSGRDLAYVIYTSGSTGKPKGVMIEHHSVINRLSWMQKRYPLSAGDLLLQKTPLVFDVSVWELFWWSWAGASLYILAPGEEKNPAALVDVINSHKVTVAHFVPSMLGIFLSWLDTNDQRNLATLRRVFASGEALKPEQVERFASLVYKHNGTQLINLYGPTEATVDVTFYDCLLNGEEKEIPIGKPIDNTQTYVLDEWGQLCGHGGTGELWLGGAGLARGYLNNTKLTDERFVYHEQLGAKLYRTGDMARWRSDGEIIYMGRADQQVKLRGQRLELGEIEYATGQYTAIKESAVVLREVQGEPSLVCYYVSRQEEIALPALRLFLEERLPGYMVPAYYVSMEQLPVTGNGKLDRNRLPLPSVDNDVTSHTGAADDQEARLVEIWSEVLQLPATQISVTKSFFDLGGHSLRAITLANRILKYFTVNISIKDLFTANTIRSLAGLIRQRQAAVYTPIKKMAGQDDYPLSPAQERLYFLYKFDTSSTAYNGGVILRLQGPLDEIQLQYAVQALVDRHEILRTSFSMTGGIPRQRVAPAVRLDISRYEVDPDDAMQVIREFVRPFDLAVAPLLRVGLIKTGPQDHILVTDAHHIIGDGISQTILVREFIRLYNKEILPAERLQYKDYAAWQQEQNSASEKSRKFWLDEFQQEIPFLELPADFDRPLLNNYPSAFLDFTIEGDELLQLRALAATENVTLFMLLLSVYNIFLAKTANVEDVVTGIPVSGREHPDLESMIGMLVNTLPVRNYPAGNNTFKNFLQTVKIKMLSCLENQDMPYEQLVDVLEIKRDAGRNPLFDTMFAFQQYKEEEQLSGDLTFSWLDAIHTETQFDMVLSVNDRNNRLDCRFEYAANLFSAETARRFAGYFKKITEAILNDKDILLSAIQIISPEEKQRLLETFNGPAVEYPAPGTVVDALELQAALAPENIALIHGPGRYSYAKLLERVNQIAWQIDERIPGAKNHRIGLLFYSSFDMMAAVLAVIKAGCAYVPLSPDAPVDRNRYILEDCDASLVLIQEDKISGHYLDGLQLTAEKIVMVGRSTDEISTATLPSKKTWPDDPVYIIYTSGTTGRPKGVEISHGNLWNYVSWSISYHGLTASDTSLLALPYFFDGFGAVFYPGLLSGGILVTIVQEEWGHTQYIAGIAATNRITFAAMLPGLYQEILNECGSGIDWSSLRKIILAGERSSPALLDASHRILPGAQVENEYGPTEATIGATHNRVYKADAINNIGKPITNTSIYILGKQEELLPLGTKGEICIAGAGIAKGYINNENLNGQKFRDDPFREGRRMYRTGDTGRWTSDGTLEILGRQDDQVKLGGYRIEPQEIERILMLHAHIKAAAILVIGDDQAKYLAAYYVSEHGISAGELKEFLSLHLPAYMVPPVYVGLQKFPYTVNGKLDKKALPQPAEDLSAASAVPVTPEEKALYRIWTKVLGKEVSLTANFFASGGDSIKSIQLSAGLLASGYDVSVKDIFLHQTVRELAAHVRLANQSAQETVTGTASLTPIQQWFFATPLIARHQFNQSVQVVFDGHVPAAVIEKIIAKLAAHHDALRMIIVKNGDGYLQVNKEAVSGIPLTVIHVDAADEIEYELIQQGNHLQAAFKLDEGPLFNLLLAHHRGQTYLLLIVHHLVIDGVSWRILLEDLKQLYRQAMQGTELVLPPKTAPFLSWSAEIQAYRQTGPFEKAKAYWLQQTTMQPSVIQPDYPSGSNRVSDGIEQSFTLDIQQTKKLLTHAPEVFQARTAELLLSALVSAFAEQFDCAAIAVDMEGHGREVIGTASFNRTVGWFTSIYPVVTAAAPGDPSRAVMLAKNAVRSIPNNGIDYLILKYQANETDQYLPSQQSQISFNYLGQDAPGLSDEGFTINFNTGQQHTAADEQRLYDFEVLGAVYGGQLTMGIKCSGRQYRQETLHALVDGVERNLLALLDHAAITEKTAYNLPGLAGDVLTREEADRLQQAHAAEDIWPLSPMQEGLLFHAGLDASADSYFEQMRVSVTGTLDMAILEQTMNDILDRHASLRAIFVQEGYTRPLQLIIRNRKIDFSYRDIRQACTDGRQEEMIALFLQADRARKFDLARDLLIRMLVLQTGDNEFVIVWTNHHIILDGWSMGVLLKEFSQLYTAHMHEQPVVLDEPASYSRYLHWLQQRDDASSISYWKKYLDGFDTPTGLPRAVVAGKPDTGYKHGSCYIHADAGLSAALKKLTERTGVTLYTILQAAWAIVLSRYNNTADCVTGSVVSGRPPEVAGIESMVGLFINTIPVRIHCDPSDSIDDFLQKIQAGNIDMAAHQYTALPAIQQTSLPGRDLFDHIMVFESYPLQPELFNVGTGENGKSFVIKEISFFDQTSYDLVLLIVPGNEISVRFDFNAHCYEQALIEDAACYFKQVLEQITSGMVSCVGEIALMSSTEMTALLEAAAGPYVPVREDTVLALVQQQVQAVPGNTALVHEQLSMTYEQLWNWSCKFSAYITREKGIKKGDRVALVLDRELYLIPAILGILKAGAAFIPVDAGYPAERINAILEDAAPQLLISRSRIAAMEKSGVTQVVDLDRELAAIAIYEADQTPVSLQQGSLAYIIYTSGSTGRPKGVMIQHGSLLNYIDWAAKTYLGDSNAFAFYSSISFDLTITSLFVPLVTGNKMILYGAHDTISLIEKIIREDRSGIIKLTPSHLKIIRDSEQLKNKTTTTLHTLIVGGEELDSRLAGIIHQYFKGMVRIFNEYGPTEATVGCMICQYDPSDKNLTVPIGVPIQNTEIHLLNDMLQPVPLDAIGEIYIGGNGVAAGYLGQPELTARKFIANPYNSSKVLYKTGDLAVKKRNGSIEFRGRADEQVKIRGFRIEPSEIAFHLMQHEKIREATVQAILINGEKQLAAYYVAESTMDSDELQNYLSARLQDYMIPSWFIQLDRLPLTDNGKLATRLLPMPDRLQVKEYIAPANDTEQFLVDTWAELLLLDKTGIGSHSSFFDLGGHSLKAMTLVNRINNKTGINLPLKKIFELRTVRNIAAYIHNTPGVRVAPIYPAAVRPHYPLSSAQQRLYFLHLLDKNSLAYNMPHAFRLSGNPDTDRLQNALRQLTERHESLRTTFRQEGEYPVQVIGTGDEVQLEVKQAKEEDIPGSIRSFIRPFDLEAGPLLRVQLVHTETASYLLIDMHHIISDGISQSILVRDFINLYTGQPLSMPLLQYKDYAVWEQRMTGQLRWSMDKKFWLDQFSDSLQRNELPLDAMRPLLRSDAGDRIIFTVKDVTALQKLAQEEEATLFMLLLSVYTMLIAKLTNQEDVVIGTPVTGRVHADTESMIGMFVNTLALRNEVKGTATFRELLRSVRERTIACFDHQAYPYEELVAALELPRDTARNPLFDAMFVYQNFDQVSLSVPELELTSYDDGHQTAKFDLLLSGGLNAEEELVFELSYATSLFSRATAARFVAYFRRLLEEAVKNSDRPVYTINLMDKQEQRLLDSYNTTQFDYDQDATLVSLLRRQAASTPGRIAVRHVSKSMSYAELDTLSDRIAVYLQQAAGVQRGDLVGLLLEREALLLAYIYGILKAGAAYVPMDPQHPAGRLNTVMQDAGLKAVLTRSAYLTEGLIPAGQLINLDEVQNEFEKITVTVLPDGPRGTDLAYVIYTSGSTGQPKGVMVEHHAVVNGLQWAQLRYPLSPADVLLQKTPLVFDVSVWELFRWSMTGASVYILEPGEEKDPETLAAVISSQAISVIHFVPSMLGLLLTGLEGVTTEKLISLRQVIASGEALRPALVNRFARSVLNQGNVQLINMYGPTEATVHVSYYDCVLDGEEREVPIGRPAGNTQMYILDKWGRLCSHGVTGELYLGGVCLARGYLNNDRLTDERFVYNEYLGMRLYRTGDLARWRSDGQLLYEGRMDTQVKLRGQRLELGEIEYQLGICEGIHDNAVLLQEINGEAWLVAYYTSDNEIDTLSLRSHLLQKLPAYMIPSWYVRLDSLPLSGNGKLDRNKLPLPEMAAKDAANTTAADKREEQLVAIWSDVLHIPASAISTDKSFFELGGHSIRAVYLINCIRESFNIIIELRKIFEHTTIQQQAAFIAGQSGVAAVSIPKAEKRERYLASKAQERLFYRQLLDRQDTGFNISGAFRLSADPDINKLTAAFRQLVEMHDILRTGFMLSDGKLYQFVRAHLPVHIARLEGKMYSSSDEAYREFIQPFDLSLDVLIRCGLFVNRDGDNLLFVDIHHSICDGISLNILINDFKKLYRNEPVAPPLLTYKDYAHWQKSNNTSLVQQKNYWKEELQKPVVPLDLPVNDVTGRAVRYRTVELDETQYRHLHTLAADANASVFMFLLSAYYILLYRMTGNEDMLVGTNAMGRTNPVLANTVGTFINVLPLRMELHPDENFNSLLRRVKTCVLGAFENQDFQFDEMMELIPKQADGQPSLVQTLFAVTDFADMSQSLHDLDFIPVVMNGANALQYELKIQAEEKDEKLHIHFLYNEPRFDETFIQVLADYYARILQQAIANGEAAIESIELEDSFNMV